MLFTNKNTSTRKENHSMLSLSRIHRMFVSPYGKLKDVVGNTTILTTEIPIFNQIIYNHHLMMSSDIRTQLTDADGYIHDVRLITWSVSPERIVGLVFLRNDEVALSEVQQLLKNRSNL